MSLSVVQHKLAKQGTGTPSTLDVTLDSATGAGNLLVAIVVTFNSPAHAMTGVTDGTTAFTQFPGARVTWNGTFAGVVSDCYYLPSSNSGKTVITLQVGVATQFLEIWVIEVSGFTSVATDGTVNNGLGGGTGVSNTDTGPTITTTATGFIAATCGTDTGAVSANPKAGNEFTSGGDATGDGFVSLVNSSAAGHTPEWSDTGAADAFTSIVVAFKEAAAAAQVPYQPYYQSIVTQ